MGRRRVLMDGKKSAAGTADDAWISKSRERRNAGVDEHWRKQEAAVAGVRRPPRDSSAAPVAVAGDADDVASG